MASSRRVLIGDGKFVNTHAEITGVANEKTGPRRRRNKAGRRKRRVLGPEGKTSVKEIGRKKFGLKKLDQLPKIVQQRLANVAEPVVHPDPDLLAAFTEKQ